MLAKIYFTFLSILLPQHKNLGNRCMNDRSLPFDNGIDQSHCRNEDRNCQLCSTRTVCTLSARSADSGSPCSGIRRWSCYKRDHSPWSRHSGRARKLESPTMSPDRVVHFSSRSTLRIYQKKRIYIDTHAVSRSYLRRRYRHRCRVRDCKCVRNYYLCGQPHTHIRSIATALCRLMPVDIPCCNRFEMDNQRRRFLG